MFSGGKTRNSRPMLQDVAANPETPSKMLRPRHQNILFTRSKNRDGMVAPARMPNHVIVLGQNQSNQTESHTTQSATASAPTSLDSDALMVDSVVNATETTPAADVENPHNEPASTLKRKRTVQFADMEGTESTSGSRKSPPPPVTNTARHLQSESQPAESPTPQSVTKLCRIGQSGALANVSFAFEAVANNQDAPWVAGFKTTAELSFSHMCSAHAFGFKALETEHRYISGTISSPDSQVVLNLATNLERLESGAVCHCDDCVVLIFPGSCDSWETLFRRKQIEITSNARLRYFIFETDDNLSKPLLPRPKHIQAERDDGNPMSFLNKKLYQNMTGELAQPPEQHVFFLAFPRHAAEEEHIIMQWLRLMNPSCEIRSSSMPGSWKSFVDEQKGMMIIHHNMSMMMHHFPEFYKLLHRDQNQFLCWALDRPIRKLPALSDEATQYGKAETLNEDTRNPDNVLSTEVPEVQLKQLFPSGSAFLLTPSFLLSHPIASLKFVNWFWQKHIAAPKPLRHGKLVVASTVEDWLFDVITTKANKHPKFGDSPDENEARVKTWDLLRQMSSRSTIEDDILSPIQFAPASISADDEQSLMNWFGAWTSSQTGNMRRFWAVGTHGEQPDRLSRLMLPIDYATPRPSSNIRIKQVSHGLQLVNDESGWEIERALREIGSNVGERPLDLYDRPLIWTESEKPYHTFVDWYMRYRNWLEPALSRGPKCKNTLLGLFHTRPNSSPEAAASPRRPWIAVYRPINPHRLPLDASELFLWDEKLSIRNKNQDISSSDLSPEQQELIRIVRTRSVLLPLQNIWIGGFDSAGIPYNHPLDKTLDCLRAFVMDYRDWLPAPAQKIPERGWKPLKNETASSSRPSELVRAETRGLAVGIEDLAVNDRKLVFQPPDIHRGKQSQTDNSLFKWSQTHTASRPAKYVFQPTMDWYTKQVKNGQGYGHVLVAPWQTVFETLNIPASGR